MSKNPASLPRRRAALAATAAALLLLPGLPAFSDDTLLFKTQSGKPYVYFIIDTSTSMNLAPGNAWLPANGDDADEDGTGPEQGGKLRLIKEALIEVLGDAFRENGDTIHFGLANYNQNELRVRGKHWLYRVQSSSAKSTALDYPRHGSVLTFGTHFASGDPGEPAGELGSCPNNFVPLAANLDKVDRFSKLSPLPADGDGVPEYAPTVLWLSKGGQNYKLTVSHGAGAFGPGTLDVRFVTEKVGPACTLSEREEVVSKLDYVTEFLMSDEVTPSSAQIADCSASDVNPAGGGGGKGGGSGNPQKKTEATGGLWPWQDAQATGTCGLGSKPFSGQGWESNYDSVPTRFPAIGDLDPESPGSPYKLKHDTTLDATSPVLDRGDMLPLHWDLTNREDLFRRLAPNWADGVPDSELEFRAAAYFEDEPRSDGLFHLKDPERRPLVAFGASPLNKAIVDFRCWYLGSEDQKCSKADFQPFGSGWDDLAVVKDFAEWGCRRPFLIIIGDGEAHGDENDATAAVASLKTARVKTWAVDFGGSCAPNSTYQSLTRAGDGQCLTPQTKQDLVDALRKIIGEIQQATRSFASAAVPTVQADVEQKVFLSNFNPLRVGPVWMGRMNAFVKPVPVLNGVPDISEVCSGPDDVRCFLWDAGEQLVQQTPPDPAVSPLGPGPDQRRVFYSRLTENGRWPETRMLFKATPFASPGGTNQEMRFDLYRGMGLAFNQVEVDATTNQTAQAATVEVTREALALKFADLAETEDDPSDDVPFVLGDIFHSNPVVTGGPSNALFFANDVDGYRAFAQKHRYRRKMLIVGANDGLLHVFEAGIFRDKDDDGVADTNPLLAPGAREEFDNGTGRELFAFAPRAALRPLKDLYLGSGTARTWTVDGSVAAADVRIDPAFAVAPVPAEREWRTVLIGGLREGGSAYYALDITQPDTVREDRDRLPNISGQATAWVPTCFNGSAACGPVPFPAQLWEFTDSVYVPSQGRVFRLDEDNAGGADLAPTWSIPNIGRIRVLEEGQAVDKYVAVFGGGLDRTHAAGNWLYMVDIETGQALYKHKLVEPGTDVSGGSAPSEPAAVDTNQDGYLDRIYIGTTKGYMYRVDLRGPDGELPALEEVTLTVPAGLPAGTGPFKLPRIRTTDTRFAPRIIFKAQQDAATPASPPRPIYFRPSVVFIARLNQYALAFGVGERADLWSAEGQDGRFYVIRDDIPIADKTTFFTEADLQPIDPASAGTSLDFLTDPNLTGKGWFLPLRVDEKLITNPFALSGVLVFTVFDPDVQIIPGQGQEEPTCRRTGTSRIFVVNATNGNGLLYDSNLLPTRFTNIQDFVTEPYTEQGQAPTAPTDDGSHFDEIPPNLQKVMDELKKLFPPNCKFGNYRIDVKTLSSDTGLVYIAPVPICIIEKNWKEF